MNFYKRIRELREDHDLSQREIAEILNIKQPQYQRYETGARDIDKVRLIAQIEKGIKRDMVCRSLVE